MTNKELLRTYCDMFLFVHLFMSAQAETTNASVTGGHFENDKVSYAESIYAEGKIGPNKCVEQCMTISRCNAVNYFQSDLLCEFLHVTFPQNVKEVKPGSFYTETSLWQMNKSPCHPNPCKDTPGRRKCIVTHHDRPLCVLLDDPCIGVQCLNDGQCRNKDGDYSCHCPAGYYGKHCEYSPCSKVTCRNSGSCIVVGSTWDCICPSGYYGSYCQYTPCTAINCQNSGSCIITGSTWQCSCLSGYYGSYCENTPCTDITCQNSGSCFISGATWECSCPSGYFGTNCEYDPCTNINCRNSGTCVVSGSSFQCNCKSGYSGTYCQNDPCYGVSSPNGGSCSVVNSQCKCCWEKLWGATECAYYSG